MIDKWAKPHNRKQLLQPVFPQPVKLPETPKFGIGVDAHPIQIDLTQGQRNQWKQICSHDFQSCMHSQARRLPAKYLTIQDQESNEWYRARNTRLQPNQMSPHLRAPRCIRPNTIAEDDATIWPLHRRPHWCCEGDAFRGKEPRRLRGTYRLSQIKQWFRVMNPVKTKTI